MRNKNEKLISVIIPTYRRFAMLQEAVQSVLRQTYQNIEIIVIDDFSNDNTADITKLSPRITYFCNKRNSGPGYSRREGLLRSRGEYVVFLDDDDYYTFDRFFENAVRLLEDNSEYIFVAANAQVFHVDTGLTDDVKLNVIGEMCASDYLEGFPFRNRKPCSTFTTIFKKSVLTATEVDKMEMVNDMPIYMRCLTAGGNVFFMEQDIGIYRIHGSNISKAMTPEFIIANLKEKAAVLARIKKANMFSSYNAWWHKQIEGTLCYYVYGNQPSFFDYNKVKKWCMKASEDKRAVKKIFMLFTAYLRNERICKIKRKIKSVFGMNP